MFDIPAPIPVDDFKRFPRLYDKRNQKGWWWCRRQVTTSITSFDIKNIASRREYEVDWVRLIVTRMHFDIGKLYRFQCKLASILIAVCNGERNPSKRTWKREIKLFEFQASWHFNLIAGPFEIEFQQLKFQFFRLVWLDERCMVRESLSSER